MRTDEIKGFRDQLAVLNRDLKGTAELDCMELALKAKVTCGTMGRIEVEVEISPDHLSQHHHFEFAIDQTYLGPIIAGCNRVLEKFPLKGDRHI